MCVWGGGGVGGYLSMERLCLMYELGEGVGGEIMCVCLSLSV